MATQIPYWGYYGNQSYFDTDPMSNSMGQDFLNGLHQIDPNARFVQTTVGESGSPVWKLQTNADIGRYVDANPGDFNPQYAAAGDNVTDSRNASHDLQGTILDPSKVRDDSLLGRNTDRSNYQLPDQSSYLDWAGPLAVMAFGGLMGGIPGLYEGVFGQGSFGGAGADVSGLGASDPFLNGGTGAMDMTGSAGTGIPGSGGYSGTGAFDMTGSAGTGLPGSEGLGGSTGGLTQAQWDEIIAGQPENGSFVGPNGTDPNGFTPGDYNDLNSFNAGLDHPSLTDRLTNLLKNPGDLLGKIPGLLGGSGGGSGGGGSGSNLLVNAGQQQKPQVEDAAAILARLYGQRSGLLGARNG